MKALVTSVTLFLVSHIAAIAQDLSGLFPFAHYTLINTPNDALGLQNPMMLINTVYEGNDGIYFNGKHPVVDQGGSWARTYYMSALTNAKFAVQVEFKIEELDDQFRCVVLCGLTTFKQYLGFFIQPTNKFTIMLSDGVFIDVDDINPQENVWYKFTMIYDTVSNNAKFYLGNNLIESANHQLVRVEGDGFVNNYYPSGGYPLKGNWRNLRIYGTEDLTALEEEFDLAAKLNIFPNPATNKLQYEYPVPNPAYWRIMAMNGESLKNGVLVDHENAIALEGLTPGIYFLQFLDKNQKLLCSKKFLKGE